MANQLILPPQQFKFKEIIDQFPTTGSPKRKVFFQAELRSISHSNASFGVIAYPSWKSGDKWIIGTKVVGIDTAGSPRVENLTQPVAFANNEIVLKMDLSKKKKNKKNKDPRKGRWTAFMKKAKKDCKDPKILEEAELVFEAKISENPHLEYDVTLNMGGNTLRVSTNPSPPALPES